MVCKDLFHYEILSKRCVACHRCLWACPTKAITGHTMEAPVIDHTRCTRCGTCLTVCPARISPIAKYTGKGIVTSSEPQALEEVTVHG
jgi:heterodisulfide reductase subunit A-like polyferredoxin